MSKPATRHLKVFVYKGYMYFVNFKANVFHIRSEDDPAVHTPKGRRVLLDAVTRGSGLDNTAHDVTPHYFRHRLKHASKVYL